ncbi:deoxyribose-phosphate aldolase [Erysipelotrichaceae bacterium MTC7]|nr:deoxyribose-phosphate aldolase [Erysipelotrichaceae bacterium MTC7]
MIGRRLDYIWNRKISYEEYLQNAVDYHMRCIFAYPDQLDFAKKILAGSDVRIACAIDFPDGIMKLDKKVEAFQKLIDLGYYEIDYVLNQENIENKDYEQIELEMQTIADLCRKHHVVDKAIVEMCKLDDPAKEEVCKIAARVKPAFLKTSTGKSFGGATIDDVKFMRNILPECVKIKASGGIHSLTQANEFIQAGADVMGATKAIEIAQEE